MNYYHGVNSKNVSHLRAPNTLLALDKDSSSNHQSSHNSKAQRPQRLSASYFQWPFILLHSQVHTLAADMYFHSLSG